MKAKKRSILFGVFALGALAAVAASVSTVVVAASSVQAAASDVTTDYNAFSVRNGTSGSITTNENEIAYTGGWDSNFAVTDQFDTRAGNYSLKAHVSSSDWTIGTDMGTGFIIYYNDTNYLNFYLKWNSGASTNSIAEGILRSRVNNNIASAYQYAVLPNGNYTTQPEWNETWSDGANWRTSVDGDGINLREKSTILVSKGFDMTLHVERATYADRLADILYIQIDAYAADGTTPLTVYTPRYAVDAMTNPFGTDVSALETKKPQIGFSQYNMSNIHYSDIVFTDKTTEKVNAKITRVGSMPSVGTVDTANNTLSYKNSNFSSGFLMTDVTPANDSTMDLQATVSGIVGDVEDTQLGFTYYFNDNNYAILYACWNGATNTISNFVSFFKVNGANTNVTSFARDPWESSYSTFGEFYNNWSDFGGWITDSQEPMGTYSNFNNFRSQSALTIASGFTYGLKRTRVTYSDRVVDAFQFHVTATGNDGVLHNWYSATVCFDAFTYPNGGEASAYLNSTPQIGFYGCNIDTVTLSNIKYNGKAVNVGYSNRELARQFNDGYMHFADVSKDNGSDTGTCRGENGYYAKAKEAWLELSADVRSLYMSDDEFADGRARLAAWASANGEKINSSNELTTQGAYQVFNKLKESDSPVFIVGGIVLAGVITLASVLYFHKKKISK